MISYTDFLNVDVRVGTIVSVEDFPEARKPSYQLTIDFGTDIGVKRSSAQITANYSKEELVGTQVVAVVNFAPKQVGPFLSEVLILGLPDSTGAIVLLRPTHNVPNGGKMV